MTSTRWDVEADTLLALPVDDLALRILKDARDTNEKNWHTWIAKAKPRYADRRDVHIPLAEAWAWLSNRGLIVWDPDQSGAGFFVISRQGDEALQRGLPW